MIHIRQSKKFRQFQAKTTEMHGQLTKVTSEKEQFKKALIEAMTNINQLQSANAQLQKTVSQLKTAASTTIDAQQLQAANEQLSTLKQENQQLTQKWEAKFADAEAAAQVR